MPTTLSPIDLTNRIQGLLKERQLHAQALADIDATLERVGAALSRGVTSAAQKPEKSPNGPSAAAKAPAQKRRGRGGFSITAGEAVLAFVKQNKTPTTAEIEKQWAKEGRRGTAANTLTKLVKDKKLKRDPLEGERGSRYSVL